MIETTKITQLPLASIRIDGGTQPRAALDQNVIQEYAQDMLLGATFPPTVVFYDGSDYWLADGFHRYHGAKQICKESIDAEIKQGTRRDAVLYSVGTNAAHGLRRSNEDKRRAAETLLNDSEWSKWSDREIARRCGVSHNFVSTLRPSLSSDDSEKRTYVTRHGTETTMNTANIGQQPIQTPILTEHEAALAGYRGYERWQEAQKWKEKGRELETPAPLTPSQEQAPSFPQLTQPLGYETTLDKVFPGWHIEPVNQVDTQPAILTPTTEETPDNQLIDAKEKRDTHVMRIMGSSESPEWYTPQDIIHLVCKLFGAIDTDPCSNSHEEPNVPARTIYTKADNGLAQIWTGTTYMNPPYGTEIGAWVEKLIHEYKNGGVTEALALLPGRIDTQWFQPLYEYHFCHIRGRLQFSNAQYSAPFPSVIAYLGPNVNLFIEVFKELGPIMRRIA